MTEAELAARLHRDVAALAREAEWSPTPTPGQEYGHYTDPISDAMKSVGITGALADATPAQQASVRQVALRFCLDRLDLHFVTLVDLRVGDREEKLSQIREALAAARTDIASGGGTARGLTIRRGPHVDYSTGEGDANA